MLDLEQYGTYCRNDLLYTEEPISGYVPGGYHPVALGDILHEGRYMIHHKLGYGSHSTVWLADDRRNKEFVAMKIMIASTPKKEGQNFDILSQHARNADEYLFENSIVGCLGSFTHAGPNGYHQCLVLELLGPNLRHFLKICPKDHPTPIHTDDICNMAEQLIRAVNFMYNAGIDHDETRRNGLSDKRVAFTRRELAKADRARCFEIMGRPRTEPLVRLDGKELDDAVPAKLVQTTKWPGVLYDPKEELRVLNFANAFPLEWPDPPVLDHPAVTNLKIVQALLPIAKVDRYIAEEAFHFVTTPSDQED